MTLRELLLASLVLALVVSVFLSPSLITGKYLSPAGMLFNYYPWQESKPAGLSPTGNDLLIDSVAQFEPWLSYSASRLHNGHLPLWNPDNMLGAPLIGNLQSAVFFPLNWPAFTFPDGQALVIRAWLKLFLCLLGMYMLARQVLRTSVLAALIAAVAFGFSSFMVVWLLHPHTATVIWLPWLWWATYRLTRASGLQPARWVAILAIIVALSILAGHGETTYHIAWATGLFLLFLVIVDRPDPGLMSASAFTSHPPPTSARITIMRSIARPAKTIGLWAGAYMLGAAISAIQLLPFLEYSSQSAAALIRLERQSDVFTLPMQYAWTIFGPDLFGNPAHHTWWGMPINYNETNNYIGLLPLLLAPFALVAPHRAGRRFAIFLLVLVILAGGLVYGWPGVSDLVLLTPGMRLVLNNRMLLLIEFCLALLAGLGCDVLLSSQHWRRTKHITLLAGICLLVGFGGIGAPLIWMHSYFQVPEESALANQVWQDSLTRTALLLLVTGFALLLILLLGGPRGTLHDSEVDLPGRLAIERGITGRVYTFLVQYVPKYLPWCLLVLLLADLFQARMDFLPTVQPSAYFPQTPVTAFLQQKLSEEGPFRIVAPTPLLFTNTNLVYGIEDIRGADAIEPLSYRELAIRQTLKYNSQTHVNPSPVLNLLNVRYMLALPGDDYSTLSDSSNSKANTGPQFVRVFDGGTTQVSVFENRAALPRAWLTHQVEIEPDPTSRLKRLSDPTFDSANVALLNAPNPGLDLVAGGTSNGSTDHVAVKEYSPERVIITASSNRAGILVLSDQVFPGWNAYVDNKPTPVLTVDHALRGVYLQPGEHTIRFEYQPLSLRLGGVISLAGLLATAFLLLIRRRGRLQRGAVAGNE